MAMGALGKDRFASRSLYPGTDRRRTGETPADRLGLGKWIRSQGRVLLRGSPGDRQCLQQLHPLDEGYPDSGTASRFVPWGGKRGRLALCLQRLPSWHGYTGSAKGAETPASWRRQRPPASASRDPREIASVLIRTGLSQGGQAEGFSSSTGGSPGVVSSRVGTRGAGRKENSISGQARG